MFYFAPEIPRGEGSVVRTYVRKRTYSTSDRVLVHLSTDSLRPEEQTQDGIAAATRSGRSTLTKWLDRMEDGGLVSRDRLRLPGHPLPKYGYRLSESGWRTAVELRGRLATQVVTVRTPNLQALAVRLSEVPALAPARLDLTGAVTAVRKGQLDLARAAPASRNQGPLVWGRGLRRVDRFFGRIDELTDLDAWWASDSRALLITGLAGIGKSALAAAWIKGRRLGVPVYGFETRRPTTPAAFLSDFGGFLAALGKPGLSARLAEKASANPTLLSQLLQRELHNQRLLVVLDNADQIPAALGRLLNELFVQDHAGLLAKVVLLGRRAPRWVHPSDRSTTALQVRHLQGLDPRASRALLRSRGLGPESKSTAAIVHETRGHPLLLYLAASAGTGHGAAVQRYLKEQLWGSLTARERTVLEALSVFRKPVSERVLETVARAEHRTVERLHERNLLERTMAGGYAMHDLVREFVGSQVSESRQRLYHARAANVLMHTADSRERWEAMYHLLRAGKVAEAAAQLDSEGAPLLDCVAAEDVASLVRGLTLDETEAFSYCVFAEILGDGLRIRGHVGPALFQYGHAQRFAETSGQPGRIPRLLRKMAFLERCRNRYDRALGYLIEARARLAEARNPAEMAEVLREMALSEQALGNLEEAARHLNEATDLATDASDRAALSRTLLALGSLEAQRGHPEQGLALDLEGLHIAERSGDVTEVAHAHIVVGAALIAIGKADASLKHLTEGFEAARLLGNLRLMAYATMNHTSGLLHLKRYKEAGTRLRQAREYFEILEEIDALGLLKTYEGEVEMGLGHWSRATHAWREGISELRSRGSPGELAFVMRDVAGFYADHGRAEGGLTYLLEAREIARKVGNLDLLSEIESELTLLRAMPARRDAI